MTDRVNNIPLELRERSQWVNWIYGTDEKGKPTKNPVSPRTGNVCNAHEPKNHSDFETVLNNAIMHNVGIGFVLTADDPYVCIDIDDPVGKALPEDIDRIFKMGNDLVTDFDSYTEFSPSGNGLHIWVRAEVPPNGVRSSADCLELYSQARFMTVTGNSLGAPKPIAERTEQARIVHTALDRTASRVFADEKPCDKTPDQVIAEIADWANAARFFELANMPFDNPNIDNSAVDIGLMNFFVRATHNIEVSRACFSATPRGKRFKWMQREDYQNRTIQRAFDQIVGKPLIDISAMIAQGKEDLRVMKEVKQKLEIKDEIVIGEKAEQYQPDPNDFSKLIDGPGTYKNPGGLLGEIMDYLYRSSYAPIPEVALSGALALMAGICGRAYNVNDLGLNLYIILLANSGTGKNAAMQAPKVLLETVAQRNTEYMKFIGGRPVSGAALSKMFGERTSFVSFYDEFGEKFYEMNQPERYPAAAQLAAPFMELYTASGRKGSMPEILHSDKDKSSKGAKSPAFSIIGSSVPTTFFAALNPKLGEKGLLPRLTIIHYEEKEMIYPNHNAKFHRPSESMLGRLMSVCENAHRINGAFPHNPLDIKADDAAWAVWREFEMSCRKTRFECRDTPHIAAMWARTAEKALKLAGLIAVGYNPYVPTISIENMRWAIAFAYHETMDIVKRFESGQVGEVDNEDDRIRDVSRFIRKWITMSDEQVAKLRSNFRELHQFRVVPRAWLWMQVHKFASFKAYKRGFGDASEGFDKCIKAMISNGLLRIETGLKYLNGTPVESACYRILDGFDC